MPCFLPLISQAFPFSAGLHDTQTVTRWSHTLVWIWSLATFDCSSCCPFLTVSFPLSSTDLSHVWATAHSWTAAPTCLLTQNPGALTPLSSQCNLHPSLNVCSPPQISGFYRVLPCIQKCLHNEPVISMGTSPSMAAWPRRSTSMWHTLFKQMAQSQPHLLEKYNS